jgi:hypothetical protein
LSLAGPLACWVIVGIAECIGTLSFKDFGIFGWLASVLCVGWRTAILSFSKGTACTFACHDGSSSSCYFLKIVRTYIKVKVAFEGFALVPGSYSVWPNDHWQVESIHKADIVEVKSHVFVQTEFSEGDGLEGRSSTWRSFSCSAIASIILHPVLPQTRPEVRSFMISKDLCPPGESLKPPPAGIWLSPNVPTQMVCLHLFLTLISCPEAIVVASSNRTNRTEEIIAIDEK